MAAHVKVRGYAGENAVARLYSPRFDPFLAIGDAPIANTAMRAVLERRRADIPGDLGWEPIGTEITLDLAASGYDVTWKGSLPIPESAAEDSHRILITEIETFQRDMMAGDPNMMFSPRDHVRERIVYADAFEL
jgi:hypothetical protein